METKFLEIEGITLLSLYEANKLPQSIVAFEGIWWLRSPSYYSDHIECVNSDGHYAGCGHVRFNICKARPVLIIPELEDLDLEKFKDSIEVFDRDWIYIGNGMALAEKSIFESRFNDSDSNDYETSEIKQKLEDWLKEQIGK